MKQSLRARTAPLPTIAPRRTVFHGRSASTAATILLGVAILTESALVSGRIRNNSSPHDTLDQTAPEPWSGPTSRPSKPDFGVGPAGTHESAAAPKAQEPQQKPALPARFVVLTGVIAYADPKEGFAFIGTSVDNTMLVRPGQQLPDGAWLREIHPKNVVLEHEGNLESVAIYRQGESAGTAEVYPLPQQAPPPPKQATPLSQQAPPPSQQAPPLPQQEPPLPQQATPLSQQATPVPQQARWEEPEDAAVDQTEPSQGKPTDTPSSRPGPDEKRQSEIPANEARSSDVLPDDVLPDDASPQQERPDAPLPASPDPADEFNDSRRQRAESRKIQSTDSWLLRDSPQLEVMLLAMPTINAAPVFIAAHRVGDGQPMPADSTRHCHSGTRMVIFL